MEGEVYVSGDKRNQKSFGAGESHVDVLKGIDLEIEKENFVCFWGRPVPGNPRC